MALPESKRFPIAFESIDPSAAARRPAKGAHALEAQPHDDLVARVGRRRGWFVAGEGGRWVVDAGEGRRILVERGSCPRGPILRLRRPMTAAPPAAGQEAELLRRNTRTAHCAFAVGSDNRATLVATLLEPSVDEDEIDSVLRSMVAGGESVASKPLGAFDRSTYKTARGSTAWESEILTKALGPAGIPFDLTGPHAVASVPLDDALRQQVHLFFDRADAWGDQIVQIIALCSAAPAEWLHKALVANPTLAFAAIGLAQFGAQESLVVVRTQLARSADPDEILASVTTVAQVAARIEADLGRSRTPQ